MLLLALHRKRHTFFKFGVCRTVRDVRDSEDLSPIDAAKYIYDKYADQYADESFSFPYDWHSVAAVELKLISYPPRHGKLSINNSVGSTTGYSKSIQYIPDPEFIGADTFVVEVKSDGIVVNIFYLMMVVPPDTPRSVINVDGDRVDVTECPQDSWIFTQPPEPDLDDLSSWIRATSLYSLLSGAKDALTGFADLSGAAIGQATGGGITLDTKAVVYGWRVDYTP